MGSAEDHYLEKEQQAQACQRSEKVAKAKEYNYRVKLINTITQRIITNPNFRFPENCIWINVNGEKLASWLIAQMPGGSGTKVFYVLSSDGKIFQYLPPYGNEKEIKFFCVNSADDPDLVNMNVHISLAITKGLCDENVLRRFGLSKDPSWTVESNGLEKERLRLQERANAAAEASMLENRNVQDYQRRVRQNTANSIWDWFKSLAVGWAIVLSIAGGFVLLCILLCLSGALDRY